MPRPRTMVRKRNKLTVPEYALWAGLVCLAVTLLGTGFWSFRIEKLNRMVVGDLLRIETGCIRYRSLYGYWPNPQDVYYDFHFGIAGNVPNRNLFSSLRAVDGPGNRDHALNPKQQECLWIPLSGRRRSGLNPQGEFIDPWGSPYQVVIDLDENRVCDLPGTVFDRVIGKSIVAWSHGPDQQPNTPDDILSWQIQLNDDIIEVTPDDEV